MVGVIDREMERIADRSNERTDMRQQRAFQRTQKTIINEKIDVCARNVM
jgi:hypothetical protein